METTNFLKEIEKLNFEDAVEVLDKHYNDRFNIKDYYNAYSMICDKFNYRKALLPHREFRQK